MTTPSSHNDMNPQKDSHSTLSDSVLQLIQQQNVAPTPRWQFLLFEYGIWGLWVLSVVLGAVAVSVMLFVFMHAGFAFFEATHDQAIYLALEVLPYVWIGVFALMAFAAYYNMRRTKHGYRYPLWQILASSLFFSVFGGMVLHTAGVGYAVDMHAGRSIPLYQSFEKMEVQLWQAPLQGRLLGMYAQESDQEQVVVFADSEGKTWLLDTVELGPIDLQHLYSKDRVRVIGVLSTSTPAYFHGCAVFPFMPVAPVSFDDIQESREAFIVRMQEHQQHMQEAFSAATDTDSIVSQRPRVCGSHAAVMRIHMRQ